jgi:hypothetical protein
MADATTVVEHENQKSLELLMISNAEEGEMNR